jgi:ubiquinone/menaquinone biosynthesis C-methylase UbiE
VDYSKDAIKLAREKLKRQDVELRKRLSFILGDINKVDLGRDKFDAVFCIDVFEHLYPEELEVLMKKVTKILKKGGKLLVHTEANRYYLDYLHHIYVYPISQFLIFLNKIFTGNNYPGLSKDPRNKYHKKQHVNEPTYFSLAKLFKKHKFRGKIITIIPYKPFLSWKDFVYNIVVYLYPLSLFPPFRFFFAYDFICVMSKRK